MTHEFISIDPEKSTIQDVHKLLLSGVAPRPIALVSTISKDGVHNLAPFSFFNAFGTNPPYVAFSPSNSGKDGSAKDTLNNVREVPECVIHAVAHTRVEQVNLASTAFDPSVDEFEKAGFTKVKSSKVKPMRVYQSPFQMECKVRDIIELGGKKGSGNLVLCEVIEFHVRKSAMEDGMLIPNNIDLVGRNGGGFYTRASGDAIFEVPKPTGVGIGIDALPKYIRESRILSANNLAQLGYLTALPERKEVLAFVDEILGEARQTGNQEMVRSALLLVEKEPDQATELLERAAKSALEKRERDFAIKAMMTIELVREK